MLDPEIAAYFSESDPVPIDAPIAQWRDAASEQVTATSGCAHNRVTTVDLFAEPTSVGKDLHARLYSIGDHVMDAPVTIWFHGGGFVLGSVETSDLLCRELCAASGVSILSVRYRLAPEDPWPAQSRDGQAWFDAVTGGRIAEVGTPRSVALAGDSAGGYLAASIRAETSTTPVGRLLLYPVTSARPDEGSYRQFAVGYGLTAQMLDRFFALTFGEGNDGFELDPNACSRGERYFVVTAECDVLRDQAEDCARRLREAGAHVVAERFLGMPHGFIQMGGLTPVAAIAASRSAQFLTSCHPRTNSLSLQV